MENAKLIKALKCCSHRNCHDCPLRDTVCGGITRLAAYAARALEDAPIAPAKEENPAVRNIKLIRTSTEDSYQLCISQLELKGYVQIQMREYKRFGDWYKDGKTIRLERDF